MPPLTHTARVLPAGQIQAWKAAGAAAAGPTDILSLPVAGDQVVAGGGGGRGRFFRGRGALCHFHRSRFSRFSAAKRLGRGSGGWACAGPTL